MNAVSEAERRGATVRSVRIVAFDALTGGQLDAWHRLRATNPQLDSPYFHPGFAAPVHAGGRPVHLVVGYDDRGGVPALLPRHSGRSSSRPTSATGTRCAGSASSNAPSTRRPAPATTSPTRTARRC